MPTRLLALALILALYTGCTVGATRVTFGVAVLADAATTDYGRGHGYVEANPVLKSYPITFSLALAALVAITAELVKGEHPTAARNLYMLGTAVHGAAAVLNVRTLTRDK